MKSTRREFLAQTSVMTLGLLALNSLRGANAPAPASPPSPARSRSGRSGAFNMCGYAAPRLEKVRIGLIGIGSRGLSAVPRLKVIDGVELKAICDVRPERLELARKALVGSQHTPEAYTGSDDAWKRLVARDDLDLIYICTPWRWHAPMALFAMEHGKHAATEIPAATSLEECWQLVETSERTRKHCMMLENCCYDFFELLTLNMAQQGFFGEIVHGEGAYLHNLLDLNFGKENYHDMWRLKENASRNGNLYPMHGLGPIAQIMNINRGDQFDYLVSMQSNDFQMGRIVEELAAKDPFFAPYVGKEFRGNMNTTTVRTHQGRTIMVQHDVTSMRPYSRIHTVVGTKGTAQKWPLPARIATGHKNWLTPEEFKQVEEKYTFPLVKYIGETAKKVGGHGGMDFLMDWRLINLLRSGRPLDMDVYDAAAWTSIGLLSEVSVANRSQSVDVPDFTAGNWQKSNQPVNLALHQPA